MAQLTVTSAMDSYMNGESPDTNYGANTTVAMGIYIAGGNKDQLNRAIANFDVSAIPAGTTVLAAKMRRTLTLADPSPHSCTIVRCSRPATWTEGGVTWKKYDAVNSWTNGGGDIDAVAPPDVHYDEATMAGDFEVTGLGGFVRDALDNRGGIVSIIMKNEDEAPSISQRSNWLAGAFWKLIIDYDPVGVVGGLSAGGEAAARPGLGARAHRPAAGHGPKRPRRGVRPATGGGA